MSGETYTCLWCEIGEAGVNDEGLHDEQYSKDHDSSNWVSYGPCPNCGALFDIGTHFTTFNTITDKGKPELHVDYDEGTSATELLMGAEAAPDMLPRIRILAGWVMPIWLDPNDKSIIVDWYGREVKVGRAWFSEDADTWMFDPMAADFRHIKAPESRFNLQDELDEGLAERLDAIINENQGAWFK